MIIYALVAAAEIAGGSLLAAALADSVENLASLEIAKGIAFVIITSGALFIFARRMLERIARENLSALRAREAALEAQERATAGLVAASVAHDFGNLLAVFMLNARHLARDESLSPRAREAADDMVAGLDGLKQLSRRIMSAASRHADGPRVVDIDKLVDETTALVRKHPALADKDLRVTRDDALVARMDQTLLVQALLNLLINAGEAARGVVTLDVHADGAAIVLEVGDDGPGISEERRERLRQPFQSTKQEGRGLGLWSVRYFVEQHGGQLELGESPLGGARFRATLPTGDGDAASAARSA